LTGAIPSWLKGTLYRVGPGVIQVGDSCFGHPFDMLAVAHRFTLDGGQGGECTYRNKIVDSRARRHHEAAGADAVASAAAAAGGNARASCSSRGSSVGSGLLALEATSAAAVDPFKSRIQK